MKQCSADFIPPLDAKVNMQEYAAKLFENAVTFEAWDDNVLVGLIAAYFNDETHKTGYITSVSTTRAYRNKGIVSHLLKHCFNYARQFHFKRIDLNVSELSHRAVFVYKKAGFRVVEKSNDLLKMQYNLDLQED